MKIAFSNWIDRRICYESDPWPWCLLVPSGLRISPEQQQAPSMLPPHLSALGASANDIGIFSLLFSFSFCHDIALSIAPSGSSAPANRGLSPYRFGIKIILFPFCWCIDRDGNLAGSSYQRNASSALPPSGLLRPAAPPQQVRFKRFCQISHKLLSQYLSRLLL